MPERGNTENSVSGVVHGPLVQAGAVHGSVFQTTNVWSTQAPAPVLASLAVPAVRPGHRTRGRAALVTAAVEAIRAGGVVVLHGVGGSGKTTVAVDVASGVGGRDVWWVDAGTGSSLVAGLHAVAVAAGADLDRVREAWTRGVGAAPELLWEALNARTSDWLLVLDNADDPDLLTAGQGHPHERRGWLRAPGGHGAVLVTTRSANAWGEAALFHVGPLSRDDGAAVLRDLAPDAGSDADAEALATRLGGLPLALRLAGSHLAAARDFPALPGLVAPTTFAEYRHMWEERSAELSEPSWDTGPARERELPRLTWELSLDLLERRGRPLARPLLRTLACLGRGPVPTELLDAAVLATSPLFPGITAAVLNGTLRALAEVGLVETDRSDRVSTIGMHPVVRDVNRHQAGADDLHRHAALTLLWHVRERVDPTEVRDWPVWRLLLDHVDPAVDTASDRTAPGVARAAAATLCHEIALFCDRAGLDRRALELNGVALTCRAELLGPDAGPTLATKHNMAFVLAKVGRLVEAADAYREVLAVELVVHGAEHEETLLTRSALADILRRNGDLAAAEDEFRAIARIVDASPSSGNRQPHYALALVLHERGRPAEAEAILREELTRARRELGDDHQHTIMLMTALADLLRESGRTTQAASLVATATAASTALVGADHESTLVLRAQAAAALAVKGDLAAAEAEFRAMLAVVTKTKGDDHPLVFELRRTLAVAYEDAGHVVAAEAEYRALVDAESRARGPGGAGWRTRFGLANTRLKRGDHETAERAFREILAERARSGATGSAEVTVRLALASCLALRGDLAGALTECRTAHDTARTSLGPDHPETERATTRLAELLIAAGDPEGGARLMRESYPDHPATLVDRANQAAALHASGAVREALVELREVVRAAEQAGHLDHPEMLLARHNLAAAAMDADELAEAEQVLRAVLPVVEARMGDTHLDAVRLRLRLGQVRHRTGDVAGAERLFTSVLTAMERLDLAESEIARTARHFLALQAFLRGDLDSARTAARDLLAVSRRTAGPRHRQTLETQFLLFVVLRRTGPPSEAGAVARDLLRKARAHEDIVAAVRELGHG
ncbi:tetratricopeptide repeat protein [Saccharothrix sp. S26]|uniref:tetratricopeptide repeat protein n=1 Tax=Saccharothrix sp. S26 TaxID=2907215 RepID=UPI001F1AC23D|nr:tetratricopeptide repeat protein [Saccharothrix sp. S26]MCE7000756.1 tetratricopeptide repeat protein [Saccharothrix sp. S26]